MILGYHAPLPPVRTGVADYAASLAEALRPHAELSINPIDPTAVDLYHLGNNRLHRAIYLKALHHPGLVVLHDAVLHHFLLGTLPEEVYVEEFVFNYGEWNRGLARDLWRNRARSAQDPRYFRYAMLRRVCLASRAVIVHNPGAAAIVKQHAPETHIIEIPHLFDATPAPDPVEVTRLRARLGVVPHATLFAVFGYLRESKRLTSVLRAFAAVSRQVPEARLLLAGAFASSDLKRSLAPMLDDERIHYAGYLTEEDFHLHAAAADVCVNLRHPAAGETSGIAIRLMGIGKPVLLTAGLETERFPESGCVRIDPPPVETEMLTAMMLWLATDPAARREIGRRAAAHTAEHHSLERCASLYLDAIRSIPLARVPLPRSRRAY